MKTRIYLDNAATTKTSQEVVDAMLPYFTENYGNASSIYEVGQRSKEAITTAREDIAKVLGAKTEEIYFTAGGSEADNWALKAAFEAYSKKGNHIITTKIEHHAILHTCEYLEKKGAEITYLDVDENGLVNLDELQKAIRPETILISIMFANNEIGTIEPVKEIGMIAKEHGVLFHTDAVQAFGQVPIDVDEMNIDMLSSSAHKINGPKGIGFLYIRKGVKIRSFVHGGAQERKRRAGTENVPGIVGYGVAAKRAAETMEVRTAKEREFGCGAAVATSSMATELVKGKTIEEALKVTNKAVMEALDGLPPVKVHCSLLAEEAIHAALWDYAEKHGIKIEGLSKPKSDIHEDEEDEEEY